MTYYLYLKFLVFLFENYSGKVFRAFKVIRKVREGERMKEKKTWVFTSPIKFFHRSHLILLFFACIFPNTTRTKK